MSEWYFAHQMVPSHLDVDTFHMFFENSVKEALGLEVTREADITWYAVSDGKKEKHDCKLALPQWADRWVVEAKWQR